MTHRRLAEPITVYRIGDPDGRFPIFSAEGARRRAGRWHRAGQGVIYTSRSYATAMLECLVHFSGMIPKGQHAITIAIPAGTSYEIVTDTSLPGWERRDQRVSRVFGAAWLADRRSAILIVPSVVARMETNVLINPDHPDARAIKPGLEYPIWWDDRLFAPSPPVRPKR